MRIALVLMSCWWLSGCQTAAPPAAEAPAAPANAVDVTAESQKLGGVEIAEAKWENLGVSLEAPGLLTWNEDRTWTVGVVASGKVLQVMAKVGDRVSKDQVLARMHTHDVHDTKASLRQARVERARAASQLELARRNVERYQRLLALQAVSRLQFEQAEAEVRDAQAAVRRAEAEVDRETQHLTEVLEIPADGGEDDHKHPPGEHDEDELVPVKAPADGVVVERKISVGVVVTMGEAAYVISDPASLWLIASFPESALSALRVGQAVEIEVQAYPGQTFPGVITRLGESMDRQTRTLQVRVATAARGRLKPEMYATARVHGQVARTLVVPESALHEINGETSVFVSQANGRFETRKVTATRREGLALVSAGLRAGEKVAAQGSYLLKSQLLQAGE